MDRKPATGYCLSPSSFHGSLLVTSIAFWLIRSKRRPTIPTIEQFQGSFCPNFLPHILPYCRRPLLPLWPPCHLPSRPTASRKSSRGRWRRSGDLVPSSSTIVEEELEALLSFPRQMSARWGPRHSPLEPLWRMSSGFSSSSRGRWWHNGPLGVFLYTAVEEGLGAILSFPRKMAAWWRPRRPPLPGFFWWI